MAFQGNLRDFSVTEVLQMLGTQRKTGCLKLESGERRALFYLIEGRIVSTRQPGMTADDPLLRFLLKVRRLSNEQYRGILTIQRESNRDLEDLLVNGRYLEAEELGGLIERQIIDDLMRLMLWPDGSYHFDPSARWQNPPLVKLSVEGLLIEVARRMDEQRRFEPRLRDQYQLLGVKDLPDTEEQLSEEECELFGVIDGRHTLSEIIEAAPLTAYEASESLHRMLEAEWIEVVGRRDPAAGPVGEPGVKPVPTQVVVPAVAPAQHAGRQVVLGVAVLAVTLGLAFAARALQPPRPAPQGVDVFAEARDRDLRFALLLYHREQGRYPAQLGDLVADGWLEPRQLAANRRIVHYRPSPDRQDYLLDYRAVE